MTSKEFKKRLRKNRFDSLMLIAGFSTATGTAAILPTTALEIPKQMLGVSAADAFLCWQI